MKLRNLLESKLDFKALKKNKVPLTDEERAEVFKKKAVWHMGNGQTISAVWKSKRKDGSFMYISNTHRCYQTANSLKAIINKFHNVIKGTA